MNSDPGLLGLAYTLSALVVLGGVVAVYALITHVQRSAAVREADLPLHPSVPSAPLLPDIPPEAREAMEAIEAMDALEAQHGDYREDPWGLDPAWFPLGCHVHVVSLDDDFYHGKYLGSDHLNHYLMSSDSGNVLAISKQPMGYKLLIAVQGPCTVKQSGDPGNGNGDDDEGGNGGDDDDDDEGGDGDGGRPTRIPPGGGRAARLPVEEQTEDLLSAIMRKRKWEER